MSLQFVQRLGSPALATFHDVFGLDEDLLAMVPQPVLAVLLLFPITEQVSDGFGLVGT
jgi:ubiquitin carboxyl-terminal hydrolase L3